MYISNLNLRKEYRSGITEKFFYLVRYLFPQSWKRITLTLIISIAITAIPAFVFSKMMIDDFIRPQKEKNNKWYVSNTSDAALVFVHGVLSDSESCWSYKKDEPRLHRYWPQMVKNDNDFGNVSIFLGGYYTDIDSGPYEIRDCANELFQGLKVEKVLQKIVLYSFATALVE